MTPYAQLTRAGQTRRLTRLAGTALGAYALSPVRLTRLAQGWNTTFRVDTAGDDRYVLRVHRPNGPTTEMIRSELVWLSALRRDTDLEVPVPVPTRDGDLVAVAAVDGVPGQRTCDVLRWLDGRFVARGLTPAHLRAIGVFTARLQEHGARFAPPDGFTRGAVDQVGATDVLVDVHSRHAGSVVEAVLDRVAQARRVLGDGPDRTGLIHADLHYENVLFQRLEMAAIDFDDCGYGPYLYDLAVTLSEVQHRPDYRSLRPALLDGYSTVRPLAAEHERLLDTFIALRFVQNMMARVEERATPLFRTTWFDQVTRNVGWFERFLATGDGSPVA